MATKKQKREAAQAKRAAYMAKVREEGLQAQDQDRAQRKAEADRLKEWAADWNDRALDILRRHGINES